MEQSRIESIVEQVLNVGSGWILALFIWSFIIAPRWGFAVHFGDNLGITSIFTVVSVVRGYAWRRFFNAGLHRLVHKFVGGFFNGRRSTQRR